MMKRLFLVMALLAVVAANSFAAVTAKSPIGFGIKEVVGVTDVKEWLEPHSSLLGFGHGIFLQAEVSKNISIQTELFYMTGGSQSSYEIGDIPFKNRIEMSYLEMPVLLKVKFGPAAAKIRPAVILGTSIAAVLSAKDNFYMEGSFLSGTDIKTDLNGTNYSLVGGLGVEIGKLCIDARYNLGLTCLTEGTDLGKPKASVISFSVGYLFI